MCLQFKNSCEARSHIFGSLVCTDMVFDSLSYIVNGQTLIGNARGNPQVYFPIPVPIPVNTIPTRVWVWCHCRFLQVTCGYSQVLRRICILIIYYTKLTYIKLIETPPLTFGAREGVVDLF